MELYPNLISILNILHRLFFTNNCIFNFCVSKLCSVDCEQSLSFFSLSVQFRSSSGETVSKYRLETANAMYVFYFRKASLHYLETGNEHDIRPIIFTNSEHVMGFKHCPRCKFVRFKENISKSNFTRIVSFLCRLSFTYKPVKLKFSAQR